MQRDHCEELRNLTSPERLRFLAYLALFIGQAARAEYPPPSGQQVDGYRQLRAFNEIYQEIAHQLLGQIEGQEHMPLELAVNDVFVHQGKLGGLSWHLEWAVDKAFASLAAPRNT